MDQRDIISNVEIYGLEESIKAAKFPFAKDIYKVEGGITPTIERLAANAIGSGHDNFLNGITVQFDLTFSMKAWVEMQRYHFIDFVSSQSTMHCITNFDIDKMCNEYVSDLTKSYLKRAVEEYKNSYSDESFLKIIYNIPSGFRLTARMTTNYRQLKTIYSQRKKHRLPEWRAFCAWCETLPHSEFICLQAEGVKQ